MPRQAQKGRKANIRRSRSAPSSDSPSYRPSTDAIKAAEEVALAAFASGLKIAAAFGTVAAKTTSLALESLATGADKFSEMVKNEALSSGRANARRTSRQRNRKEASKEEDQG